MTSTPGGSAKCSPDGSPSPVDKGVGERQSMKFGCRFDHRLGNIAQNVHPGPLGFRAAIPAAPWHVNEPFTYDS